MGVFDFATGKLPELKEIDTDVNALEADGRKTMAELKRDSARLELVWHGEKSLHKGRPKELNESGILEELFKEYLDLRREVKILEQIEIAKDNEKKRQQLRKHLPVLPDALRDRFHFEEEQEKERIMRQIAVMKQSRFLQSGTHIEAKISEFRREIENRKPMGKGLNSAAQFRRNFELYKAYAERCIDFYGRLKDFIEKLHSDLDSMASDVQKFNS